VKGLRCGLWLLVWLLGVPGLSPAREAGADGPPVGDPWPSLEARSVSSRDGTRIAYWTGGQGGTTVVMVHGWSCNHRFFGPQFAALAPSYRIVALDLAGHGQSGPRQGPVTVPAFADDLAAVVDREVEGPFILLVHSTGGRVASEALHRLGPRLLGVVGIDTFQNLGTPYPPGKLEELIAQRVASQRQDFVADTRRYVASFFQPGADPAIVAWVDRQMTTTQPEAAIAATEAFARFDARAAVKGWRGPVLAINSDWVPTDYRAIRELLPGFDLVILPGRGHFPNLDDPASFNPILLAMIKRIESAPKSARSGPADLRQ
jgi:pimeloyl-ACP methyl ester carboxylesterase